MKIDHLREFLDLAHTLSFTDTARHFFTTQSVLSKHISGIEKEVGCELLLRTKNGVHLTKAGRLFLEGCSEAILDYDRGLESILNYNQGKGDPIHIGYLYAASAFFLPPALQSFKRKNPSLEVTYQSLEIDEIISSFDEGKINFAICCDLSEIDTDRFCVKPLYPDTFALIAPKNHRLAKKSAVGLDDLSGESIIVPQASFMYRESTFIRTFIEQIPSLKKQNGLIIDLNSVRMSILVENCCAIELAHLAHNFKASEFCFIPLKGDIPKFNIVAIWKKSSHRDVYDQLADELVTQIEKVSS